MKDSYQNNISFTKHKRFPFVMSQLEEMMYFVKLKGNNPKQIEPRNIAPCIPKSFTP